MKLSKRLLSLLLTLTMLATLFAGLSITASAAIPASSTWTEVAWKDIADGDTIIIANTNNIALPNASTSGSPSKTSVTVSGSTGTLTVTPGSGTLENLAWDVDIQSGAGSASMIAKLYQHDSTDVNLYLSGTGSNTALRVGTSTSNNTFTMGSSGKLLKLSSGARFVGEYVSGSDWRTYSTETATNYSGQSLKFYRLNSSGSVTTRTISTSVSPSGAGTVALGASEVAEGGTTTATATANAGYVFTGWTVSGTGAALSSATDNPVTITVGTSDVTVTATFTVRTAATLTYSENGATHNDAGTHYVGDSVTLAAPVETAPVNHTFVGWLPTTYAANDTAPAGLLQAGESYTLSSASNTLYAVYARENGTPTSFYLTNNVENGKDYIFVSSNTAGTAYALDGDKLPSSTSNTAENATAVTVIGGETPYVDIGTAGTLVFHVEVDEKIGAYTKYRMTATVNGEERYLTINGSGIGYGSTYKAGFDSENGLLGTNSKNDKVYYVYYSGDGIMKAETNVSGRVYAYVKNPSTFSGYTTSVNTAAAYYTLTYSVSPADSGAITCGTASGSLVEEDTEVTLTAAAEEHWLFSSWTVTGTTAYTADGNTLTVTMTDDVTVTANFTAEPTYTVTIAGGITGGTVSADKTSGIYAGETVTLTATPAAHYTFTSWAVTDSSSNPVAVSGNTFTMPASDVTVSAIFTEAQKYHAVFYVGGSAVSDTEYYTGEAVSAPDVSDVGAYRFVGWLTSASYTSGTEILTAIPAMGTADAGYYAVYAIASVSADTLRKITSLSELTDGITVAIVNRDANMAMTSSAIGAQKVTVTNNTIPANGAYQWTLGVANGVYTFTNSNGQKLAVSGTSARTEASLGDSYDEWTITAAEQEAYAGAWNLKLNDAEMYLEYWYSANAKWQTYGSISGNYANCFAVDFYIPSLSYSGYTTAPSSTQYTVTFYDIDGTTVLNSAEYYENTRPTADTPSWPDDGETYYTFAGWSDGSETYTAQNLPLVTGDTSYTATRASGTYAYTFSLGQTSGQTAVKVNKTLQLTAALTVSPEKTLPAVTYSSSDSRVATVNGSGVVTGIAEGSVTITASFTDAAGIVHTVTYALTVNPASGSGAGYTLITEAPEDWSGDYIIAGRKSGGNTAELNNLMIMTPGYDVTIDETHYDVVVEDGGVGLAQNNASWLNLTVNGDEATGFAEDVYSYHADSEHPAYAEVYMSSSGDNDIDGNMVLDYIEIDDSFAFTVEQVDDVNHYYTIRVKGTNYYLANSVTTDAGNNAIGYVTSVGDDTKALWTLEMYGNTQIVLITSVYSPNRYLMFNPDGWTADDGNPTPDNSVENSRFRVYGSRSAKEDTIGSTGYGGGQSYSLFLFGNPNPFKAQIYYKGDQITVANGGDVYADAATCTVTGALTPDIDSYPGWTLVSGPVWSVASKSPANNMTVDTDTGVISVNGSAVDSYAQIMVTYTVHDELNNRDVTVNTVAQMNVVASAETYSTIIYETYSGDDTEVQYTVASNVGELPLAAYVMKDSTEETSKSGDVTIGGALSWSTVDAASAASAVSLGGTYTVSVSAAGLLTFSLASGKTLADDIVLVKVTGATGNNVAASAGTYKVYIKAVTYTTAIINAASATTGTYNSETDTITYTGDETFGNLGYTVTDSYDHGPGADTFTLRGGAWSISGNDCGVTINSAGRLDFSEVDRSADHTVTVVLSRLSATDTHGVLTSGLTDTITIVIQRLFSDIAVADDTVLLDWALPVTFNVLTNDDIRLDDGAVPEITYSTLPEGVTANADNGSFTFTPSGWLNWVEYKTFTYTVSGIAEGESASGTATVTLKLADSIYYEESYNGIFTYTDGANGSWTAVTDGVPVTEQTSSLDSGDIFGYDSGYAGYARYSAGTARKTVVSKGTAANNPTVTFTFTGNGFDIISATTAGTGAFKLELFDGDSTATADRIFARVIRTTRGYGYNADGVKQFALKRVDRYNADGVKYTEGAELADYTYIRSGEELIAATQFYTPETFSADTYYTEAELNAIKDDDGFCVVNESKTVTSHWTPVSEISDASSYWQIPVVRERLQDYGTYTVRLTPTYTASADMLGAGSYEFYFDGIRVYSPVERTEAYKYISLHDAVAENGFGSGVVVACDHEDYEWSDWDFYSAASNSTGNRGAYVQYCANCHGVANTAYFHVTAAAEATALGVNGYHGLPASARLSYTLTADATDAAGVQAAVQAKLNALQSTLVESWRSSKATVLTTSYGVAYAQGAGTAYATLQLKNSGTQQVIASAIRTPEITVSGVAAHDHTFGEWTHNVDSEPSTHTRSCTFEECTVSETENCAFTSEVTTEPTAASPGVRTYTCTRCGYSYTEIADYTVTYSVQDGVTYSGGSRDGNSITLPSTVLIPDSYNAQNYTFVGWTTSTTLTEPGTQPECYQPGATVNITENTVFYPLYSYSGNGFGATTFNLVTDADGISSGSYVLVVKAEGTNCGDYTYYALKKQASGTSYVASQEADSFMGTDTAPGNVTVTDDNIIFTLTGSSAGFTLTTFDSTIAYTGSNNLSYGNNSATTWTPTQVQGTSTFTLKNGSKYMGLRTDLALSSGMPRFRCNNSAPDASYYFYLYKRAGSGTATYTFTLEAAAGGNASKPAVRSVPAGNFTGGVVIDGMGSSATKDDFAAYGPNYSVYLGAGQGIVFKLTSDKPIETQDLQLAAKALNGTAAKLDVVAISQGVKYLLAGQTIASGTEMYYDLDGSAVDWATEDGASESSVIVIYNSGSGVLCVTNLRYSAVNDNTLTLSVSNAEITRAIHALQALNGTAPTLDDSNAKVEKLRFTDVAEGSWYYSSVAAVSKAGLMNGTSGTTFEPDKQLTRAELVQVLYKLLDGAPVDIDNPFTDVKEGKWYTDAVLWAYASGITVGTAEGKFSPDMPVTREQLAQFLCNAFGGGAAADTAVLDRFPDAGSVSRWAKQAMAWAVSENILSGAASANGTVTLMPKSVSTRAMIAVMVSRLPKSRAA